MSKFSQIYKEMLMPSLPLYGLGEIVSYGGFRWEITGFEPNEAKGCWVYDLKRVDGTDETESSIHELGLAKSYVKQVVEKPGPGHEHSAKWDRCVQHVKESGSADNAYAVCSAMMKSEVVSKMTDDDFDTKMKMYMQKLGIAGAGPVPNSLLAAQDLEGSTQKSMDLDSFAVWYYDKFGARKCSVFANIIDAEAFANLVDSMGYEGIKILKGQVEQTGEELKQAAEEAETAETSEKKTLVQNIKAIQLRRQKATLAERAKETAKSFKQVWSNINKKSN